MYGLISPNSRDAYSPEAFVDEYNTAAILMTLNTLHTQVISSLREGTTAAVLYDVRFHTDRFGDIVDAGRTMRLIETTEGWRVAWSRADIFAELTEGARLELKQTQPGRGSIYDRDGGLLADQNGRAIQLFLVKQDIPDAQACIAELARILNRDPATLQERFNLFGDKIRFEIGEVNPDTYLAEEQTLLLRCDVGDDSEDTKVRMTRRYFGGPLAAHIVGYVSRIRPEQMEDYTRRGYPQDAVIGQTGIEQSYENYLAGKIGAQLVIVSSLGEVQRVLAEVKAEPGQSVYLTIDRELEEAIYQMFEEAYTYAGPAWNWSSHGAAAVVMNVKTGEILAMVSYPSFDPSVFNPDSAIPDREEQVAAVESDPRTPLLNRATMGLYPAGSVFKIVSMAAGLESGVYEENQGWTCSGRWYGGETYGDSEPYRTDWLATGHGWVTFPWALTYSCDPYFWQLGVNLHAEDPTLLEQYAHKMGLGVATGQTDVPEEIGQIPNDEIVFRYKGRGWHIADTLNLVIGQGEMQITPLQITRMIAAVANGGTMVKPLFVSKIQLIGEEPVYLAEPTPTEVLDFDPHTFELIRDAMCQVTLDPNGTARYIFEPWYKVHGTEIVVCGKTGTAQTGGAGVKPHAWFAAFAPQDDPEIAVVVVVENSCEGSEVAAPMVGRIIEDYYGMPHADWPSFWQGGCVPLGE